jgi:hypothetical protein
LIHMVRLCLCNAIAGSGIGDRIGRSQFCHPLSPRNLTYPLHKIQELKLTFRIKSVLKEKATSCVYDEISRSRCPLTIVFENRKAINRLAWQLSSFHK